jgi:hypothetical protein
VIVPASGQVTLTFYLGDAPSGYELIIAGHTPDGRLGAIRDFLPVARSAPSVLPAPGVPPPGPMAPNEAITPPANVIPPLPPVR